MKRTFLERRRASGALLVVRGTIDKRGARLVVEEISPDGVVRSVRLPIAEVASLLGALKDGLRWWRERTGAAAAEQAAGGES